ncbi:class I SAM-dependent methyltransferase [uncultured Clostridium sp.]|uniref:class I SAM-dependent methyltransferase n=1 Tax=uncultured Clostridium sp. TaxID=59620 RepID=UPI0025F5B404|nr:class I SAM-dependent methyltransferase [uncultured Clostridium sp.]
MKAKLTGVSETLLIPLWARASETVRSDSIIKDNKAVEMVKKIDYDFSKFENGWMSQTGVSVRTKIFDDEIKKFISKYPDAVIINIGCGLDTRFERIDNGKITWYDLDLPESIEVRKKFFEESDRYKMIAKSVLDNSWTRYVSRKDKKLLVMAEGILMYFSKDEVIKMFDILKDEFRTFKFLGEISAPFVVKNSKKHETVKKINSNAVFKWGIKNAKELETYRSYIKVIDEWNFFDFNKPRWRFMGKLSIFPFIKNMNNRIVDLEIK